MSIVYLRYVPYCEVGLPVEIGLYFSANRMWRPDGGKWDEQDEWTDRWWMVGDVSSEVASDEASRDPVCPMTWWHRELCATFVGQIG